MTRDGSLLWIAAAAGAAAALVVACTLPTGGTGEGTGTTTSTSSGTGAGGDIGIGGFGGMTTTSAGGAGGAGGAGAGGPACGAPWARKLASAMGFGSASAVAVDPTGPVVFAGTFKGTTDIDGTELTAGAAGDVLLVKRDEAGAPLWARAFSSSSSSAPDFARGVAVDGASNIILTGGCDTGIDFGGGPIEVPTGDNGFITKLDEAGGFVWHRRLQQAFGNAVAINEQNQIFVAGEMTAALTLPDNGGNNVSIDFRGGVDALLTRVNGNGNAEWGKSYGDDTFQHAYAVAARGNTVIATGDFENEIRFDMANGGTRNSVDAFDAWLVKVRVDGSYVWNRQIGGAGDQKGVGVGIDPGTQDVVVAVQFDGAIDFDGSTYTASNASTGDIFLVKYASDGAPLWSRHITGGTEQEVRALHVDGAGRIFVTGHIKGTVTIDPTHTLTSGSKKNVFVLVLDPAGEHVYSWVYPASDHDQVGTAITTDACNNAVLGGTYDGVLNLGGGAGLDTPGGGQDVFFGKLRPSPSLP